MIVLYPEIRKYNVTSAYDILESRLGNGSRILATIFFLMLRFLWMSTIVFATVKIALLPIMGLSNSWTPIISATIILFTIVFTTFGGLKAVVETDALQSLIMFFGALITIVIIIFRLGDISILSETSLYSGWAHWEWAPKRGIRMTVSNVFLMNLFWQICTAGSDQMAIQRYLSVKDAKSASRSYNISLISSGSIIILLSILGMLLLAYFTTNPHLLPEGMNVHSSADLLFPTFIRIGLPIGITGLIAAALIAAAISSLSSGLNSVSSVIYEDIIKRSTHYHETRSSLKITKWLSALIGVAVLFFSFLFGHIQGNLLDIMMKVGHLVVAPLFVLFFIALFSPHATDRGAIFGGLSSFAAAFAVSFFGLFGFVQTWNIVVALVVGIPIGILVSLLDYTFIVKKQDVRDDQPT